MQNEPKQFRRRDVIAGGAVVVGAEVLGLSTSEVEAQSETPETAKLRRVLREYDGSDGSISTCLSVIKEKFVGLEPAADIALLVDAEKDPKQFINNASTFLSKRNRDVLKVWDFMVGLGLDAWPENLRNEILKAGRQSLQKEKNKPELEVSDPQALQQATKKLRGAYLEIWSYSLLPKIAFNAAITAEKVKSIQDTQRRAHAFAVDIVKIVEEQFQRNKQKPVRDAAIACIEIMKTALDMKK